MSVWDDLIHRLEQDLAQCRRDLELLESGQMQHRERRDGGAWVDTTQQEIDWHKKTIGMYEGLVRTGLRASRRRDKMKTRTNGKATDDGSIDAKEPNREFFGPNRELNR